MTMARARIVPLAALAMLALAGPASAGGAAFGPAQALDLRVSGPPAAAGGPRGEAVVAGVNAAAPVGQRVEVATRAGSGAPWTVASLGPSAAQARDVQVVIARGGRSSRGVRLAATDRRSSSRRAAPAVR
jgi:hypothetical protein